MKNVEIKEIMCSHPVPKFPYYHAKIKLQNNSGNTYYINKLIANREGVRDYLIYANEDFVFEPMIKPGKTTYIYARVDWENNDEVNIEFELVEEIEKSVDHLSLSVSTPSYGGYWNKDWEHYFSIVATERFGIERVNQPIHLSTTVYLDHITDPKKEVRVVEVDSTTGAQKEIPSQVYGVSPAYTGVNDDSIQHSISFDVAFFANVKKNDARVYLVFYGNKKADKPQYMSKFVITGTAPGITVENDYYRITMNNKSGSIYEVETKMGVNKTLEHKVETNGSVHWNPGYYAPPTPWTHTSDWDPIPYYFEESGPIFLMTQRSGKMPLYDNTFASQTYIFYSETPYIRTNSILDINKSAHVQAVRNGEIVFNLETITSFAFKDKLGEIKHTVITDLPRFEEVALTYDEDAPWVAFYSSEKKFGFAEVTLKTAAMRRMGGLVRLEHSNQYLNWGPWFYWTRNLIFPFCSQNPARMCFVPETSTYYEDMLFMPFKMREDFDKNIQFKDIDEVYQMFFNPLNIQVEFETDKRVPAQFILGPRLEGEVKETEEKPWPITLDKRYTRFRQSPIILNEIHFKEKDGKYYYR